MKLTTRPRRLTMAILAVVVTPLTALSGCEPAEFAVDDVVAQWEGRESTIWTYDNNSGQTTATITGKSIYPYRNKNFDEINGENTEKGSVVSVSVGNHVVDIVGSSTLICGDGVPLIPRHEIDEARGSSTDPAMPWLNILKRRTSDLFEGQPRVAIIKTQNDIPVAAFTGQSVTMVSGNAEIKNSTWFKVHDGGESHYCFASRVNYTVMDTALLD